MRRALRLAIEALCTVLDLTVDEPKQLILENVDAPALESLLEALRSRRAWP